MRRKLAAVLAADVVGYSRMMESDATATLAALMRLRAEVFDPLVAARRGQIVKSLGDGWIVVFGTATEAVECAMQVQDRLATDPLIRLRAGIHIGDVALTGDDVFGDAVNLASRLQTIAGPGAVVISEPVFLMLDGTLRPSFDEAGLRWLKNIARPLKVLVRGGEVAGGSADRALAGFPRLSIAPVRTSDPRPEVQDLATALSGDLLTCLDGTQWLRARIAAAPEPSAFRLACLLRAHGDRVRLELVLTRPDGAPLHAEKVDGSLADSFAWQDSTVPAVATRLFRRLMAHVGRDLDATPRALRTAEQWAMLAIIRGGADGEGHRRALDCLAEAIRLAPDWGYVHGLALAVLMGGVSLGLSAHIAPYLDRHAAWAERVDALEPVVSPGRIMLAFARLVRTRDPNTVRADVRAQLQGLPFEPDVLIWAGYIHLFIGEPEAALECFARFDRCVTLDAYVPAVRSGAAGALVQLRRFDEAIAKADEALRLNPLAPSPHRAKAAALGWLGRADDAAQALAGLHVVSPGETLAKFRSQAGFCDTPATRVFFEGLLKAGMAP